MKSIIRWFAGFLEDKSGEGTGSSKRLALFICLYYLKIMIEGDLAGKTVDQTILAAVVLVILFCVGAITSEFFKDVTMFKKTESKTTEETLK